MALSDDSTLVVFSGAGLSKASGVPTFREEGGLWRTHDVGRVATIQAWRTDPDTVRRFHDALRRGLVGTRPNEGHLALARLQRAWGPERVVLVTQNGDGLLQDAGAVDVIEMHGSMRRLRCEADEDHPRVHEDGDQDPAAVCATCRAPLRPDVVFFGEMSPAWSRIHAAMDRCELLWAVGTSGAVYPSEMWIRLAHRVGGRAVEINPHPTHPDWDEHIEEPAERALPRLVADLLETA